MDTIKSYSKIQDEVMTIVRMLCSTVEADKHNYTKQLSNHYIKLNLESIGEELIKLSNKIEE